MSILRINNRKSIKCVTAENAEQGTYTSYDPPYYEDYGSDQSKWIIRAYEYMTYPDPSENHQSTFNIFSIDKETGAVYDEILMHPVIDDEGNYVDWIYH